MNSKMKCVMAGIAAVLLCGTATAGILPGDMFHKFEVNLHGFAYIKVMDPDGTPGSGDEYLAGRNLALVTSVMKDQGKVPYIPYPYVVGAEGLPGPYNDRSFSGVLGFMAAGLKIIAVDDYNPITNSYTRITGDSSLLAWASNSHTMFDVIYLGDDPNFPGSPYGVFWHDPTAVNSTFQPGTDGWNAVGSTFSAGAFTNQQLGDALDTLILTTSFNDLSGVRVLDPPFPSLVAPAGTLVINVTSPQGTIRPIFIMEVTGGTDASLVVPGGMSATYDWWNGSTFVPKTFVGDIVSSVGAQPWVPPPGTPTPPFGPWVTMSDPTEWVAQPEPGSLAVWALLATVGFGALYLKRRR